MATIKAKDQVTVLDITDAYSVILTSEAYTFVGNTSGAPSGLSCSTQVVAYQGSTPVQKITVTVTPPSGITANIAGNGGNSPTITFTTTSTITASCEATIAVKIDDTTINKKFSFSVAKEGSAGKGIKSTSITYQAGSFGTTAPTGTWVTSPPKTTAAAPYMWTKTVITYTDDTTSTSYSVGSTPEGIQVGGTNLYTGTKDFTGSAWANYSSATGYSLYDSKYKDFTVIKKSSLWGGIHQPINTINGDIYTLSFYAKGDLGTRLTLVASNKAVTEGIYNGISVIGGNFTVDRDWWGVSNDATEWKRYWGVIKISVDGAILSAKPELSTNSVGTVYICGLKLEKGNTPTDWTPAPEDTGSYVSIGGRNLLRYSDSISPNWVANGSSNNVSTVMEDGVKCIKVTRSDDTTMIPSITTSLPPVVLDWNSEYTVSVWLKFNVGFPSWPSSAVDSTPVHWHFGALASIPTGPEVSITISAGSIKVVEGVGAFVANKWKKIVLRIKTLESAPDGYPYACFRPFIYGDSKYGGNETKNVEVMMRGYKIEKGNIATDWTPAPEDAIASVDVEYYLSTSATSLAGGSWSTTAPAWVNGKYMWSRTVKTDGAGNKTYSPSQNGVCIAGAKGDTGSTGAKGDTGAAGKGVTSIVEQYYKSTSATALAGGSWSTTYPGWENGKYIWTRSAITYTDSTTPVYTTAICVTGQKGDTGSAGETGTSVINYITYYKLQSSTEDFPEKPTTYPPASDAGWMITEPAYQAGKTLYFIDCTVYSNGDFAYSGVSVSSSYEAAKSVYNDITMYYRFDDSGQYIGKEGSTTQMHLVNDALTIEVNGEAVTRIDDGGFNADQITIKQLTVGGYTLGLVNGKLRIS